MRATLRWDNAEKTTVCFEFLNGWTWDDLDAAIACMDRLAATSHRPMDAIVDVRGAEPVANAEMFRLHVMESGKAFARHAAEMPYRFAVVGASAMIKAMYHRYHLAQTSEPANVEFAPTVEAARHALQLHQLRHIVHAATAFG